MSSRRFADMDLAWCRIAAKLDVAETNAAIALGTLPIPASDIPTPHATRIADAVALELSRIAMEVLP